MDAVQSFVFKKRKPLTGKEKEEAQKKIAALEEKDNEPVYGMFKAYNGRHKVELMSHFYKDDGYDKYEFENGKYYTIPRKLMNYINTYACTPDREYATDQNGVKQLYTVIKRKDQKYEFIETAQPRT